MVYSEDISLLNTSEYYDWVNYISAGFESLNGVLGKSVDKYYGVGYELIKMSNNREMGVRQYDSCIVGHNIPIKVSDRTIFNMCIKQHDYDKASLESISSCFERLKILCEFEEYSIIAIPKFAYNEGVYWKDVLEIIHKNFDNSKTDILICNYEYEKDNEQRGLNAKRGKREPDKVTEEISEEQDNGLRKGFTRKGNKPNKTRYSKRC